MTSDEFIDRIGVGPETDICALENVYRHLVATGANIGDVLRGEAKPSPKPDLSELEKLRDAAEAAYRAGGGSYHEGKVDAFNEAIDRLEAK